MTQSVWSLKDVTLNGRVRPRLTSVSLEIPSGVTAVLGSSGAGKSSLLGVLTDFEQPHAGSVSFRTTGSAASLPLFWSPQDDGLWPHLSVQEHIEYVRPSTPRIDRSVMQWLDLLKLGTLKDSRPELLSQGERCRLAVARTLASEASVVVMDEPLVHVDPLLAHDCWQAIDGHLRQHCSAAIFTTHHPDPVLRYASNVICLQDGAVTFSGSVHALYSEPPTRELAWLLGPCNWFGRAENDAETAVGCLASLTRDAPCGDSNHREWPACVRPADLEVRADALGGFVVEVVAQAATVAELRLRARDSNVYYDVYVSRVAHDIGIGEAVQLALLRKSP